MLSSRSPKARALVPALLVALALAALPTRAAADSWSRTGSISGPRMWGTATLLPNGQVLVAGGQDDAGSTSITERWDPASGQWLATPSFPTDRYHQAATLLSDGRVLMTGGRIDSGARGILNSWLTYDPATNAWSSPAAMPNPHSQHAQVTLQDGRVLVIGGLRTDGSQVASSEVEIFDPASGTWTPGPALPNPVANATATLLRDGSVLVAGGESSEVRRNDAVRWFPATNQWRSAGTFTDARSTHVAALLPDGKVLIAGGGTTGATYLRSASVYDPVANRWTDVAPMAIARDETVAVTLPNGKVLVPGGAQGSAYLNTAELFDPATNSWSPAASMAATRGRHTVTLLADGRVLVVGGEGIEAGARTNGLLSSAEIYTPDGWPFTRGGGGRGGTGGGGSGRPGISRLALSATRFRAAGSGPSIVAARKRRPPVGTTITYSDGAAATAIFTVLRPTAGRGVNGRCVRTTRANRRHRRCTRWVAVGRFRHADAAGTNSVRFSGRVGGDALLPGRYRLSVSARAEGGRASAARTIGFRIVG